MSGNGITLEGLKLFELKLFRDDRGYFVERFNRNKFAELGLPVDFFQDNHSVSHPKVLRGLHYQSHPAQGKLVSCLSGSIFDVAVDVRIGSPTFGQWNGVELNEENGRVFWLPAGFAHGFCVLGDKPAHVLYKVTTPWSASGEGTISYADSSIGIDWPVKDPILSTKDREGMTLGDYEAVMGNQPSWW